ncbi:MAG: hypothetical protein RLY20_1510 [Verrucomicrobiota bacterium]|jgi:chromosome segregation ATPase
MTLAEIKTAVAGLLARANTADQSLRADVTALQARVDGDVTKLTNDLAAATAENTKLQTSLTEATEKLTKLDADFAAVNSKLAEVCAALKVADAEKLDATGKVVALQTATNNAIAQTGVDLTALPSGGAPAKSAGPKTMKRADWSNLPPKAQAEFFRNGGNLTE